MKRLILVTVLSFLLFPAIGQADHAGEWKAGVARTVITPEQPIWMAGYAARDHPAEGKLHDLWAKALAIEDARGHQAVLVTTDLLGIPKGMSDTIRDRLEARFGISRAQIMLNSSHTHSGPVLQHALSDIYPLDEAGKEKIVQYTRKLTDQLVALVGKALHSMEEAHLYAENGVTRFQVNRRNNKEATLVRQTDLNGPNDYAVPVLKVADASGNVMAVVFGYACHNTVLDGYQWAGDYAGFAQLTLEEAYPGTTALFFQGAGADQNPIPRKSVPLARQYGKTLAAAVERVLDGTMRELPSLLSTAYGEVELPLTAPPSKEELSKLAKESQGYPKRWARRLMKKMERKEPFMTSYPYPVQVWQLGGQPLIALGGELVVEYAIRLKELFGQDIFVLGYSNDVMAYIPSATILREGGYEGATSQMVYGLPGTWASNVEILILRKVASVAREAGIEKPESRLFK